MKTTKRFFSIWILVFAFTIVSQAIAAEEVPTSDESKVALEEVEEVRDEVVSELELATEEVADVAKEVAVPAEEKGSTLGKINEKLFAVIFYDLAFGSIVVPDVERNGDVRFDEKGIPKTKTVKVPFIIVVLVFGGLFFTYWFGCINLRGFKHAIDIVRGKFDRKEDKGEISHFRALTSALSATVGLGNIAGVAIAIQAGGPGAVFWMLLIAVFGMSTKFSSCTLAQMYRQENADGSISGGPMYYLDLGLKNMGLGSLGKFLGFLFAFMVMGGAIGGGNMFQANQTVEALSSTFGIGENGRLIAGIVMAFFVGLVILGGIKRIGAATSKIVPAMCGIYVLASLAVIGSHIEEVPNVIMLICSAAFDKNAFFGGIIGVIVTGVQRASFSNEAGLGSAAIAHAAAKTDEPVREGMVAMLGPFIDTIVVCLMTALVVIITGAYANPELAAQGGNIGVTLTTEAFATVFPWFSYVLTICICLFAYSTMISWCYYGERGWIYIFDHLGGAGLKSVVVFRIIFVVGVVFGAVNKLSDVLDFTDAMILSMAFPNIIGSIILAPKVKAKLQDYWSRYTSGEMKAVN